MKHTILHVATVTLTTCVLLAIHFADSTIMAAFYAPGTLAMDGKPLLAVDGACLILQNKDGIWASDPAQKARSWVVC